MFHANWPHATQLLPHAGARKTPSPPAHSWYTLTLMRPLSTEPHLSTFQTAVWFIYNSWSPPRWQRTLGSCHDGSNDQLLWSRQSSLKCWVNESLIHFFSEEEWQEPNHCPARHFPCNHTPLLSGLQTSPLPPKSLSSALFYCDENWSPETCCLHSPTAYSRRSQNWIHLCLTLSPKPLFSFTFCWMDIEYQDWFLHLNISTYCPI